MKILTVKSQDKINKLQNCIDTLKEIQEEFNSPAFKRALSDLETIKFLRETQIKK